MQRNLIKGDYSGPISQQLSVRLAKPLNEKLIHVIINDNSAIFNIKDGWIIIVLPPAELKKPCSFEIKVLPFDN
jgi:hypothetical protein